MIDKLVFENDSFIWAILIGACLLFVVFIWKEWSTRGWRFWVNSSVAVLVILALAGIALKPAILHTAEVEKAVVLSSGFQENQLDSLKRMYKNIPVLTYKPGERIFKNNTEINSVYILGNGIASFDLWQLEKIASTYLGGTKPKGIIKLSYNKQAFVGDSLVLNAIYSQPENGNRMLLQGPAGSGIDSISLSEEKETTLRLKAQLKVQGNYLFRLTEKDAAGKILVSNPVPVCVKEKKALQILVVNAFPTFETKYLKNYLAEAGHHLMLRSQITRGRYKTEYFNRSRRSGATFSKNNLSDFDLLILDNPSLNALSNSERKTLEQQVREEGLGVFIQVNTNYFNSGSDFFKLVSTRNNQTEISLGKWPKLRLQKVPFLFKDDPSLAVIHGASNRILAAAKPKGLGKVGASVLSDTYQLVLDGHSSEYQELWAGILSTLSKQGSSLAEWETNSAMAIKNQPFHFKLRTSVTQPIVRNAAGNEIPIRQNIAIPYLWEGTTYPRETGWDKLQVDEDSLSGFRFYTADSSRWRAKNAQDISEKNIRFFNNDLREGVRKEVKLPINPIWFYLLFLLGMGYLWLEPKMRSL